jgi:hypothetical protein
MPDPTLRELLTARLDALDLLLKERDHRYEDRFVSMDAKTTLALSSSEKAITKAEFATEKRFDAVNEFRGTLSDQAATLMPRAEALSLFKGFSEQISELKNDVGLLRENQSRSGGKELAHEKSVGITIAIVLSLIASAIAAVGIFMHH